jgi:predicted anti-sigma-YlaC factor YlaD
VSWDHERVQELLAGQALGGLDDEDAALAERAVAEHLPECESCARVHREFREVAGDLSLAVPASEPPELLSRRVSRVAVAPPRRLGAGVVAAGVAVVALTGLSVWTVALDRRLEEAEIRQDWMVDALSAVGTPDVAVLRLRGTGRVAMLRDRQGEGHYLLASGLPEGTYQVWLLGDSTSWSPGTFESRHGAAMIPVHTDMDRWHTVMVTAAPGGAAPKPTVSPLASALVRDG